MLAMTKKKRGRPAGKAEPKDVLHIMLPPELKEQLRALAERNHRKITAEVILALERHVAEPELPNS